jgi:hypothetical protein
MPNLKTVSCPHCGDKFKQEHGRQKYCKLQCTKAANARARSKKKKENIKLVTTPNNRASRGENYMSFVKNYAEEVLEGIITQKFVAEDMSIDQSVVTRMLLAYKEDKAIHKARENWDVPEEAIKSLESFEEFRNRYFLTETGQPYETAKFHKNWIKNILKAIDKGEQLMILSPPRHGKTDLLTHFAVWQICKLPNIRIMWVGGNEDISKNAVGSVLDHLENNEQLIQDFCGPGETFKPKSRTGKTWSSGQFTVKSRTVTGIKSPTMVAVGKGGKILSRDCDLIIADDIEDHSTTIQPSSREQTKRWWTTTLSSRKEEHTSIVVIGSRQHPDDLYNSLIDNDEWKKIIESAHSLDIPIDSGPDKDHKKHMLWASKRSYKWLMSQRRNAQTTGGLAIFEMVYLNRPFSEGLQMFKVDSLDASRDESRSIGNIPSGCRLIAGLDPAATGYQAAFLWAFNVEEGKLYMVDIENTKGGGIPQAFKTIKEWYTKYHCSHWIIEENGFQRAIRQDRELKEWTSSKGVHLEGHQTQKNKFDPYFGVGSMSELFDKGKVNLPYGSADSQNKSNIYRRQLLYFSNAASKASSRGYKSDIVMASWFPIKIVRRLQKEFVAELAHEYTPSYANVDISNINTAPW